METVLGIHKNTSLEWGRHWWLNQDLHWPKPALLHIIFIFKLLPRWNSGSYLCSMVFVGFDAENLYQFRDFKGLGNHFVVRL